MTMNHSKYTVDQAAAAIALHNHRIDEYINVTLAEKMGAKNGMIKASQWFEAQRYIREQNFYEKGRVIQMELRADGYDVKMDMQSNKLVCSELA